MTWDDDAIKLTCYFIEKARDAGYRYLSLFNGNYQVVAKFAIPTRDGLVIGNSLVFDLRTNTPWFTNQMGFVEDSPVELKYDTTYIKKLFLGTDTLKENSLYDPMEMTVLLRNLNLLLDNRERFRENTVRLRGYLNQILYWLNNGTITGGFYRDDTLVLYKESIPTLLLSLGYSHSSSITVSAGCTDRDKRIIPLFLKEYPRTFYSPAQLENAVSNLGWFIVNVRTLEKQIRRNKEYVEYLKYLKTSPLIG